MGERENDKDSARHKVSTVAETKKSSRAHTSKSRQKQNERDPFVRAENEDDDGYDPYSDRSPKPEPLFERDPWN